MGKDKEYENNLEVCFKEIGAEEYNQRIVRVIKCLLEMANDSDKVMISTNTDHQEAA